MLKSKSNIKLWLSKGEWRLGHIQRACKFFTFVILHSYLIIVNFHHRLRFSGL
jgi:hypothetical protein